LLGTVQLVPEVREMTVFCANARSEAEKERRKHAAKTNRARGG
jgi:hypothetical protein